MTDAQESPAARRHRFAYAMRALSSVDAAAQLLEVFERAAGLDAVTAFCVGHPMASAPADTLDDVDVPWELAELESLPDWTYETLVKFAIDRRPAPSFQRADEPQPRIMHATDLLAGRKYELIGLLSLACEQAWNLGDAGAVKAMSKLCETAVLRVIGLAALRVGLGVKDDSPGDAE